MRRVPWKVILCAAGALLLSLVIEYLMVLNFSDLMRAYHNQQSQRTFGKHSLGFVDCAISDDGTVTVDGDSPQILIRDVNAYVSMIDICVSDLPCSAVHGTLYWSEEKEPDAFSEECSLPVLLREDAGSITVNLDQQAASLRIDLQLADDDTMQLRMIVTNPHVMVYLKHNLFRMSVVRIIVYWLLILIALAALFNRAYFLKTAYRYRWWIGLSAIAVCTLLKLHGSSIGLVSEWLTGADTSRLWLQGRSIRSDEFVVFTQMALSQAKSGFRWFSEVWGYSPSDMFIVYGQPVGNLVTLYRPFSAGYLLLGPEYGLSFYWVSRLIICWLVSFEFGRIVTGDRKKLSAAYACLIALSPVVQWWFSTNELVEMLIFGQGAVVLFKLLFNVSITDRIRRLACKSCIIIGLVICSGGYILTLYPAWMVPFFYVFFACGVSFIIEKRSVIRLKREDVLLLLAGAALLLVSMLYIYHISGDTIRAVMNTAFPGKRVYAGGPIDNIVHLFRGWSSCLWSFIDTANPCEMVDFISFFPLGFLLSLVVIFKEKKRDIWLIILNLTSIFLVCYLLFEMPEVIGKLTMMSNTTFRLVNAVGLINLIILFRAVSLNADGFSKGTVCAANCVTIVAVVFTFFHAGSSLTPTMRSVVMILALFLTNVLLRYHQDSFRNLFLILAIIISVIGGALVNPINSGLGTLYHADVLQEIESINRRSGGTWAVNGPLTYANLPAVVGAKSITALATYPDFQMWQDLGLADEESETIWNRYAHMELKVSEETRVEAPSGDLLHLYITPDDLRKLGVNYVLSTEAIDIDEDLTSLYSRNGLRIYRVEY